MGIGHDKIVVAISILPPNQHADSTRRTSPLAASPSHRAIERTPAGLELVETDLTAPKIDSR